MSADEDDEIGTERPDDLEDFWPLFIILWVVPAVMIIICIIASFFDNGPTP